MEFTFTHPGRPATKGRPRFTRKGGVYTPPEVVAAETDLALHYTASSGPEFAGPFGMSVDFTAEETRVSLWEEVWTSPLAGDLDNYVKLVVDGLQGVAYKNDRQLVSLYARKL